MKARQFATKLIEAVDVLKATGSEPPEIFIRKGDSGVEHKVKKVKVRERRIILEY